MNVDNMFNLKTYKLAIVSMYHITPNDCLILDSAPEQDILAVYATSFYWDIPLDNHNLIDHDMVGAGFSAAFVSLVNRAKNQGVDILRIDVNGEEYNSYLPSFTHN